MPDLSNLLGAVYGEGPSSRDRDPEDEAHVEKEPAAAERGPAVPDWADDEHLDAAFAEWKPASSAEGSEHAFVMDADDDPAPPLADDLAAALSEALVAASGTADDSGDVDAKPQFDFSADDEAAAEEPQDLSKFDFHVDEQAETEQPHELGEVSSEVEETPPEEAPQPELTAEPEPEPEPEPESAPEPELVAEPEPEPVTHLDETDEDDDDEEDEVYEAPRPSFTTQREAAAELTAANRIESEPVVAPHVDEPEPEFAPLAAAPVPVAPEPAPVPSAFANDGATAPTTLPAGTRRWDRSNDDILPEKQAKKFFSFSLRRG